MVEDGENNFKMVKQKTMKMKKKMSRRQVFGPVSTINSAPVAIGNSLRGTKPVVLQTKDGVRVMGRDFAFSARSTVAAVTDWELIGGMPLTPSVLATTTLKSFSQIYNEFKFNKVNVHYITSSPTSQAGDVMFYYERNRYSPAMDYSNNSFLNYVLSDVQTVIGPQWANHTATIVPENQFKLTSFGNSTDQDDDSQGAIYFFSKTNSANSPGYILIDYDITFKNLAINPRAGLLPITRGAFSSLTLSLGSTAVTLGVTDVKGLLLTSGKTPDGTASALPSGAKGGDVYKCVFAVTASTKAGVNSAWTVITSSNFLANADDVDTPVAVDDGFTCYLKIYDTTIGTAGNYVGALYPTAENAATDTKVYKYGATGTVVFDLCTTISLVYSIASSAQVSAY